MNPPTEEKRGRVKASGERGETEQRRIKKIHDTETKAQEERWSLAVPDRGQVGPFSGVKETDSERQVRK